MSSWVLHRDADGDMYLCEGVFLRVDFDGETYDSARDGMQYHDVASWEIPDPEGVALHMWAIHSWARGLTDSTPKTRWTARAQAVWGNLYQPSVRSSDNTL